MVALSKIPTAPQPELFWGRTAVNMISATLIAGEIRNGWVARVGRGGFSEGVVQLQERMTRCDAGYRSWLWREGTCRMME